MYDPAIGRWHVPDPLSEYHYNLTPNHYVMNNPMRFIDPFGLDTTTVVDPDGNPHFELDEVTVKPRNEASTSSSTPTQNYGWVFDGGYGRPGVKAKNSEYMGNIWDWLNPFSGWGRPKHPMGNMKTATERASDLVEKFVETKSDAQIKKEATGTGVETDNRGGTKNIEKVTGVEFGDGQYKSWIKQKDRMDVGSVYMDATSDSVLFIFNGDSTLFVRPSSRVGYRVKKDLSNKK
jgi:hypothetical protein